MISVRHSEQMDKHRQAGLTRWFHFSPRADDQSPWLPPEPLRLISDNLIAAQDGFVWERPQKLAILTYVIEGALTISGGMGPPHMLAAGSAHYWSAGGGETYKGYNRHGQRLRLLHICLNAAAGNGAPSGRIIQPTAEDKRDQWYHLGSGRGGAPLRIHQGSELFVCTLSGGREISYPVSDSRQIYLIQISGEADVSGHALKDRDAAAIQGEPVQLQALSDSHCLLFDLPAGEPG